MTTTAAPATPPRAGAAPILDCGRCGFRVMDGEVLRTRVVRPGRGHSESKCPRCKEWVIVPLRLD